MPAVSPAPVLLRRDGRRAFVPAVTVSEAVVEHPSDNPVVLFISAWISSTVVEGLCLASSTVVYRSDGLLDRRLVDLRVCVSRAGWVVVIIFW